MKSIDEIIEQTIIEMRRLYPGIKSQKNYHGGFTRLKKHYHEHGVTLYSKKVSDDCVNKHLVMFKAQEISESTFKCVRKAASLLDMFVTTGNLVWKKELPISMRVLPFSIDAQIKKYSNFCIAKGELAERSIKAHVNHIRTFSAHLVTKGILQFEELSAHVLYNEVIDFLKSHYVNKGHFLSIMRSFFHFLKSEKVTIQDLSDILPIRVSGARKKVIEGFSDNELNRIIKAIDTSTSLGKRNYAIIMLAIETGLRGIDLLNLKLQDILWKQCRIELIQHKTDKPIALPVSISTLNAIADYILNVRPEVDEPYVFLRSVHPFTALAKGTTSVILQKYMDISHIEHTVDQCRGFHSLRRSVGTRMLRAGIPVHTISEILGHSTINSTKPYITIHTEGLKSCAIDLSGISITEGILK